MDSMTIGQYRVTGVIGRGGMGAVYAGEHTLIGRQAAIKVLLPELSQKQDVVLRFFNEARAATAIRHPGIVEIYDFGWTPEGAAFIVMEHLDGETLGRRASRVRLRWPAVLAIARQIAGALAAAHAKGIVHRDLKPDNVFLVPDPEVPGGERIKLLDFGIAKLAADPSSAVNVTKTGAVMGTPTYMSPEQCRGVSVDHRADLYALGCVIYELCCGRPPFLGEGTGDVLAAHIHMPIPEISGAASEIPPAVATLVRRLLAKAPADRMQSAEDLIAAIDGLTLDRTTSTSGPRRAMPVTTSPTVTTLSGSASISMQLPGSGTRRRWPLAVFSAAMAAITAVIVALVMRTSDGGNRTTSHPTEAPAAAPSGAAAQSAAPMNGSAAPMNGSPAAAEPAPAGSSAPPQPEPAAASAPAGTQAVEPSKPAPEPPPASPPHVDREPGDRPATPARTARPPEPSQPPTPPVQREPVPPTTVDVVVESSPAGARVMLDGTVLGTTPFRGTLPRRDRDVKLLIRLDGYADRTVIAHSSQPITEHVKLVRAAPPPQHSTKANRDQSVNPF